MHSKYAIILIVSAIFAGKAIAGDKPPSSDHGDGHNATHDHDHDHAAPATPKDEFAALDTDRDAALSRQELAKHRLAAHFSMIDTNKDGRLNRSEFDAAKGM
ncbi:MAG: EF-hand domain-containing protein [Pseudomonadota bacterium]